MTQDSVIEKLRNQKEYLQERFSVQSMALFGSFARNENTTRSDLDILVNFKEKNFSNWAECKIFLEELLELKVDLLTEGSHLKPRFVKIIQKDLIYV